MLFLQTRIGTMSERNSLRHFFGSFAPMQNAGGKLSLAPNKLAPLHIYHLPDAALTKVHCITIPELRLSLVHVVFEATCGFHGM